MRAEIEAFCKISKLLTGESHLDPSLAELLLTRLQHTSESKKSLDRLWGALASIEVGLSNGEDSSDLINRSILADDDLRRLAGMIIILWFLGDVRTVDDAPLPGTPREHFEALFWRIIHAHPPALSGGYFGHWAYPPDN